MAAWHQHARGAAIALFLFLSPLIGTTLILTTNMLVFGWWSSRLYHLAMWRMASSWFIHVIALLEKFAGVRFVVTGDELPADGSESALITSNHPSEADWLWFWALALRGRMVGNVKVLLKDVLMYAPGLGWAMDWFGFIFLRRDWTVDRAQITHTVTSYGERPHERYWLFLFPEGTDYTRRKHERSKRYGRQHGLPEYRHLLLPRTKGFTHCAALCRNATHALYDVTIAYDGPHRPSFWSALCGSSPRVVHMHVRRWPRAALPAADDAQAWTQWCYDMFAAKDALLERFAKDGRFADAPARWFAPRISAALAVGHVAFWLAFVTCSYYAFYAYWPVRYYVYAGWLFELLGRCWPLRCVRGFAPWPADAAANAPPPAKQQPTQAARAAAGTKTD